MRRFLLTATLFALIGMAATVAVTGFGGIPFRADASQTEPVASTLHSGPKIAVFNMAAVWKEYGKVKYQDNLLNEKRQKLTAEILRLQKEYLDLQNQGCRLGEPSFRFDDLPKGYERLSPGRKLVQQIEEKDRQINKLNEKAEGIISALYKEIKFTVGKTAEMNGYDIVFVYSDTTGPYDLKNSSLKELKLNPPAAQPFYVAKHVDITGAVIQALNAWDAYSAPPIP